MARSLLPREHGAYVQLAAPLVAAITAYGVTLASLLLAVGACCAFVANELLLVMLGHRGKRADKARAKRWLAVLVPAAALAGITGLVLAPSPIAALVAVPACGLVVLAWRKRERTFGGELLAAVTLTGAAAPVAIAAGASFEGAATLWLVWAIGFVATVIAVHRVLERRRVLAVDAAVIFGLAIAAPLAGPCIPLVVAAMVVVAVAPAAKFLRMIGFTLVGASLISIAVFAFA